MERKGTTKAAGTRHFNEDIMDGEAHMEKKSAVRKIVPKGVSEEKNVTEDEIEFIEDI